MGCAVVAKAICPCSPPTKMRSLTLAHSSPDSSPIKPLGDLEESECEPGLYLVPSDRFKTKSGSLLNLLPSELASEVSIFSELVNFQCITNEFSLNSIYGLFCGCYSKFQQYSMLTT